MLYGIRPCKKVANRIINQDIAIISSSSNTNSEFTTDEENAIYDGFCCHVDKKRNSCVSHLSSPDVWSGIMAVWPTPLITTTASRGDIFVHLGKKQLRDRAVSYETTNKHIAASALARFQVSFQAGTQDGRTGKEGGQVEQQTVTPPTHPL